jgi:hypothetical protein
MDAVAGIVRRDCLCRRALDRLQRRRARGTELHLGPLRCHHDERDHPLPLPRTRSPDNLARESDRLLYAGARFRLFDGQPGGCRRHGGRTHSGSRKPSPARPRRVDLARHQVGTDGGGECVRRGFSRDSRQPTALPRLSERPSDPAFSGAAIVMGLAGVVVLAAALLPLGLRMARSRSQLKAVRDSADGTG